MVHEVQMSWGFIVLMIALSYLIIIFGLNHRLFLSKKQTRILTAVLLCMIVICRLYIGFYTVLLPFIFIAIHFFFTLNYLKSWLAATYLIILEYTIISFSWFLTFDLPRIVIHIDFFATFWNMFFFHVIQQLVLLGLVFAARFFNKKLDIFHSLQMIQKKFKVQSLICLLIITVFVGIHHGQTYPEHVDSFLYTFIIILILFLFLIFLVWFSKKQEHDALALEFRQKTILNLQKTMITSEEFRHDYKNLLIVLARLLNNNQLEEAKEYLNALIDYSSDLLSVDYQEKLNKIEIYQVQHYLYAFLSSNRNSRIHLSLEIEEPITSIAMNPIDYLRCLSILINNAVEALETVDQPKLFIRFTLEDNSVVFTVKNNIQETIPLDRIFTKKYSTKKGHTGNGLAIFQRIVNSYKKASTFTELDNNYFTIYLIVPI